MPNEVIGRDLNREEYVMYLRAAQTRVQDAEVLMNSIQPYFNREGKTFCSHQHAPSSGKAGYAAVTRKGNVIYFAHPVFRIYRKNCANWCKQIMKDAIALLLPQKLVSHNGPSTMITSLNRQESQNRDILHVLHYITEKRSEDIYTIEDIIPLYNVSFKLFVGNRRVQSVQIAPEGTAVAFEQKDGTLTFTLQKMEGHTLVDIQY